MSIGSSGGTAVKSAALVVAPLGLAVFACCGHRSLPRQLAVLPNGMVPGTICPGCRIRIFGWSCVFLRSFVTSRCVVHHVRHQSSYFVRRPPLMPPPRCSVKHNNCNRSGPGTLLWNRTRCLRNKKRKTIIATHSSSSASSTIYVYKTDVSIALTTLQSSSMIVHIFTLEQKKSITKTKKYVMDSNFRSQGHSESSLAIHLLIVGSYMIIFQTDMFLHVRMDVSVKMTK